MDKNTMEDVLNIYFFEIKKKIFEDNLWDKWNILPSLFGGGLNVSKWIIEIVNWFSR